MSEPPPSEPAPRRRAPGMSPEQRRAMIVAAALPLVAEHGAAVTTARIARAAGIGEATIFRVFADKDELLDACVAEALSPGHVLRELGSIDLELPLPERLTEAAEAMRAHLERIGAVVGALYASGRRRGRPGGEQPAQDDREASARALREAVAELLEPDRDALRLPLEKVAAIFIGTLFAQMRGGALGGDGPTPADLADVLLHGVLKQPHSQSHSRPQGPDGPRSVA
ncbi:TetR/AcrR family transcriptional regulator [Streptomyces sp. S.PNR 29]|uniref:TetR/AcrR family transcriptional regulator n=1 Tax=Streptomyces sp. S.PNR 29 TaxID=2973805 RepID=UPI0025B0BFCC|nr:TetR/AcrR family transcriptional regulator [Streptomyces sp. S.PNR 29]MDN0195396.1 TetR/AcrR family transcriptional regulator [Streptomyces sp. S.PNR 29]